MKIDMFFPGLRRTADDVWHYDGDLVLDSTCADEENVVELYAPLHVHGSVRSVGDLTVAHGSLQVFGDLRVSAGGLRVRHEAEVSGDLVVYGAVDVGQHLHVHGDLVVDSGVRAGLDVRCKTLRTYLDVHAGTAPWRNTTRAEKLIVVGGLEYVSYKCGSGHRTPGKEAA